MNGIVHFEIPVDDMDAAQKFYKTVFGWQITTNDMPGGGSYTSAVTTPTDQETLTPKQPGAINGALIPRGQQFKGPIVTVGVDSIDDAIAKVVEAGGSKLVDKAVIPDMGEYAYVSDPSGNVIGLWRDTPPQA